MANQKKKKILKITIGTLAAAAISAAVISSAVSCGSGSSSSSSNQTQNSTTNNTANLNLDVVDASTNKPIQVINGKYQVTLGEKVKVTTSIQNGTGSYKYTCTQDINNSLNNLSLTNNELTLPIDQDSSLTFNATQGNSSYNQTINFNVVKSTYTASLAATGSAANPGAIIGTQLYCSPNSDVALTFNLDQTTEGTTTTLYASNFVAKAGTFTLYGSTTATFDANAASVIGTFYNRDLVDATSWKATISTSELTSYKYIIGCFSLPGNQTIYTQAYTTVDSSLQPVSSASNEDFAANSDGSYSITPTLGVNLEMNKDFVMPTGWKASDVEYNWYYSTDDSTWKQVDISTTSTSTYGINSFAGNNSDGIIGAAGWYRLEITNQATKQTIYTAAVDLKTSPVTGFTPEIRIGSKALSNGESFTLYSTSVPLSGVEFGAIISGVFVPADKLQDAKLTYTVNKGKTQDYSPNTTLLLTEGTNVINISESFEFSGVNFTESITFNVNCYNTIILGPSGAATTAVQSQSCDAAYDSKITLGPTDSYAKQFAGGTYEWYQVNKVTSADGKVTYEKVGNVLSNDLNYSFDVNFDTPNYYELIATMPAYIGGKLVYQTVTSEPIEVIPTITNTSATITPVGATSEKDYYVTTSQIINVNAAIVYNKTSLTSSQLQNTKVTWTLNGTTLNTTSFDLSQLNLMTGKNTLTVSIVYSFNTSEQVTKTASITIYYYALQVSPNTGFENQSGSWTVSYGAKVTLQIDTNQQQVFSSGFTYQWYEVENGTKTGSALSTDASYTFTYDTNDTTSYELIATTSGGVEITSNILTIEPELQNYTTTEVLSDIVDKISNSGMINAESDIPALQSTQITNSNVTSIIESYLKAKLGSEYVISGPGYNTVDVLASDVSYSVAINGSANTATVTVTYQGESQTITITNFYQESMSPTQQLQALIEQLGQTTNMNSSNQLMVNASLLFGTDNIVNSAVTTKAITDWFTNKVGTSYDLKNPGYVPVTIEGSQLTWTATINQSANDATVTVAYKVNGVSTTITFVIVNFAMTSFTSQEVANVIAQKLSDNTIDPTSTTSTYNLDISKTTLGSINVADSDAQSKIDSYVDNLISNDFESAYTIAQAGYKSVEVSKSDFTSTISIDKTANTATITITYDGVKSTVTLSGFTVHHFDAQTILNQVIADWTKNSDPTDFTKNVIDISDINALKNLNVQYEQNVYNTLNDWIPLAIGAQVSSSDLTYSAPGYETVNVDTNNITIPAEKWTTNEKGVTVGTGGITFPSATAIGTNANNENSVIVELTWTYNGQTATTEVTFTGFATGQPDGQTAVGLIMDYFTTHTGANPYYSQNTIGTLDASKTTGPDSLANVSISDSSLDSKLTAYFDSVIGTNGFEIGAAGLPEITVKQSYLTFTYTPDPTTNTVSVKMVLKNTYNGTAYTGTTTFTITNLYLTPIPAQTVVNDIAKAMSDSSYTINASTNSTLKAYYLVNSNIDSEITSYLNGMIGSTGLSVTNGSGYQPLTITSSDYTLKVTPNLQTETASVVVTYDGASQTITISDFTPATLTTSQITSWIANKICAGKTIDAKTTIPSLKTTEIVNSDVSSDIVSYLTSTLALPQTINEPGYNSVALATSNVKFVVTLNESANTATVTVEYNNSTTDTATINIDDFYLGTIDDSTIAGDIASQLAKMTTTDASTNSTLKSIYLITSGAQSQIETYLKSLIPSAGWTFTQDGANPVTVTSTDFTIAVKINLIADTASNPNASTATVSVTYDGATSSYTITNFTQPQLVVSDNNIQEIFDSIPQLNVKNGQINVSDTELSHLSINNNYAAGTSYVDNVVLNYLKTFIKADGLAVNVPGYQTLTIKASDLAFSISSSSNTSEIIVNLTYTSPTNKNNTASTSFTLTGFDIVNAAISDGSVSTVTSNSAVPFKLNVTDNSKAVDLTSSNTNLSDLKVTWYVNGKATSYSGDSIAFVPNVGINSVYAIVTFTYYGEPYQIQTSPISLSYECASISDAQSTMSGYGISHTLTYDSAATQSYVPFASTAKYQWEISTDGGKTWTNDGKATSSATPLTFSAWQAAQYRLVITDSSNSKDSITSNVISITANLSDDTANVSASSTDSNVVTSATSYNGSHVEIFYNDKGSATLTVGLSEGKSMVSDLANQTGVTYTWTIDPLGSATAKTTTLTTTAPTLSSTFFEKYGTCKVTVSIKVNNETITATDSWIMTNSSLAISATATSSHLLLNNNVNDQINVTEGATVTITSSLTASVIKTTETLPSGDSYILLSGTSNSLIAAKVVTDNTSGKSTGVFTIDAPNTVSANQTTYYWVEAVSGAGSSQMIIATSNAYEVVVIAPVSATQTTTPTADNNSTNPSITFPITYSSTLPAIITPTIGTVNVTLSSTILGTNSPKNTDNALYSYKISNVTENGFDIVFSSFSKEFMSLLTVYQTFYFELSNVEASLSGTTINNVFMSGLTIKTQTISYSNSKFVPPAASTSSSTTSSSSTSSTKATSSSTDSTKVATFTQNGLTDHVYPGDQIELRTNDVLPVSWSIQWQQKNADGSWSDLSDAHTNLVKLPATYTQPGQSYTFRAKYTNNNTTIYSNATTYTVSDNGSATIGLTISDK